MLVCVGVCFFVVMGLDVIDVGCWYEVVIYLLEIWLGWDWYWVVSVFDICLMCYFIFDFSDGFDGIFMLEVMVFMWDVDYGVVMVEVEEVLVWVWVYFGDW